MRSHKHFLLLISTLLWNMTFSQTNDRLTSNERACIDIFGKFLQHSKQRLKELSRMNVLIDSTGQNQESKIANDSVKLAQRRIDTIDVKFVLAEYILSINIKTDLSPAEQFKIASSEIYEFYDLFNNKKFENFEILPLRLSTDHYDKFIYNHLSNFQKENTFVLLEKIKSKQLIGYILFAPAKSLSSSSSRILSWKLTFCYGNYYFTDILGHLGVEYLFQGIKGPKHPIDIKKEIGILEK